MKRYSISSQDLAAVLISTVLGAAVALFVNLADAVTVEQLPARPATPAVHLSPNLRPVVPAEKSAKTTSTTSTKEPH